MRTHVRFRCTLFAPQKPDGEQVNPGVYGEELADWVRRGIGKYGRPAQDCFAEDWGWMVVFGRDYPASIGCGNVEDSEHWLCFCEVRLTVFDRFLRRPGPLAARDQTTRALQALIASEPRIHEAEWFSVDSRGREFDHSSSLD